MKKKNSATHYVFPCALLSSLMLAFLAFTVTSGMALPAVAEAAQVIPTTQSIASELPVTELKSEEPITKKEESKAGADTPEKVEQNNSDCQVSSNFPEKILRWCDQITRYAHKTDLDPNLVAALILQESGGNPNAYSNSGAVGLMQVMPRDGLAAGFSCINGPCFADRPTINQLEDPKFNIQYGSKMLAGLVRKHGNMREALKAYGPMNVGYYYADIVLKLYKRYRD